MEAWAREKTPRSADRQAEDDLDELAKAAGRFAERQRQTGRDDDDHRDDFGDRTLDGFEHLLERLFPRHAGTGRPGLRRHDDGRAEDDRSEQRGIRSTGKKGEHGHSPW